MAERVQEIYSLLIPLVDGTAHHSARLRRRSHRLSHALGDDRRAAVVHRHGRLEWRARCRSSPLKAHAGRDSRRLPGRTRIVIFHCIGSRLEGGYFGIVSQGFPQLVRVSSDVVRPDNSRVNRAPIICQVRMVNETPLVPDLERLEDMIAQETHIKSERCVRLRSAR